MFFTETTFVGIDPSAGKRPFVYSAIDYELNLLAISHGSIDDVLAFAAGLHQAVIGVCAPRRLNQGLMDDEDFRLELNPAPAPGRWRDHRVAEYLLCQRNIRLPRTPQNIEDAPGWVRMGFQLYDRLEEIGYRQFSEDHDECIYLEVYPHASYCALLGILPFKKGTIEGRMQRQLVLYSQNMSIPNPMRVLDEITRFRLLNGVLPLAKLYEPEQLDSLVAAFTAWIAATKPDEISRIGNINEGQIIIPKRVLKEHYS